MNLFAPERPEITPGRKALLIDGSAIPAVTITVLPFDYEVSVQLREYDSGEVFSYRRHSTVIQDVSHFLTLFRGNPEVTLAIYFKWHPQSSARQAKDIRHAAPTLDFGPSAETLL